jgi:hypothetical protein
MSCTASTLYSYPVGIDYIAVDASGIYFADSDRQIRGCPRTGCQGLPKLLATVSGNVAKLVLAGDFVYWLTSDNGTGVIERVVKPAF